MEVSSQLHVPATLSRGRRPGEYRKGGWGGQVLTFFFKKILMSVPGFEPRCLPMTALTVLYVPMASGGPERSTIGLLTTPTVA
jgi:hypothetical protein